MKDKLKKAGLITLKAISLPFFLCAFAFFIFGYIFWSVQANVEMPNENDPLNR